MILTEKKNDIVVVGNDTSKKAGISQKKMAKLQYLLTKGLYKDPITAVIAEWTNNGIDSVVQAGKDPIQNPVLVKIQTNDRNQVVFSVEDKGIGLDDVDFETICMEYLESTKEEDDDTIGHFGIGMKSFLALERPATFTCIKNGIERRYLVYEGEEFVNYNLVSELPTSEENGVKAELVIKDYTEKHQFINRATVKLAYYDTAVFIIDGVIQKSKIYRHELFQYTSAITDGNMHIALKDVYYPIDWDSLGIKPINVPVALRFKLSDGIRPTPSRESYISNGPTKELITNKIKAFAEWAIKKYNEKFKDEYSILRGLRWISWNEPTIELEDRSIKLNNISNYSRYRIGEPKVTGANLLTPSWYKSHMIDLFAEYKVYAVYDTVWKGQKITEPLGHYLNQFFKAVLVNESPVGNLRQFLKEKYGRHTVFVKKVYDREIDCISLDLKHLKSFETILLLNSKKPDQRKALIDEFEFVRNHTAKEFVDETNTENTQEFIDWVTARKERQKQERLERGVKKREAIIKKDKGEITIAYARDSYAGSGAVFEKGVYKVEDLEKNKYLTVICENDDDKGKIDHLHGLLPSYGQSAMGKVRFATVGVTFRSRVPNRDNFTTFKEFMKTSKWINRLSTAILFCKVITKFERSFNTPYVGIFTTINPSIKKDLDVVQEYVKRYTRLSNCSTRLEYEWLLDIGFDQNRWDMELWHVLVRIVQNQKKYNFVNYLASLSYLAEDSKKGDIVRMVNQVLTFRNRHYPKPSPFNIKDYDSRKPIIKNKIDNNEVV